MTRFSTGVRLAALGALLTLTPAAAARQGGHTFDVELEISRSAAEVVLEYHRDVAMLAEPDPTPLVRIYGDGRYVVHFPAYMKRAGDWEGRIAGEELDGLARSMVAGGLLELDVPATRRQIRDAELAARREAAKAARPVELYEVSDRESTRIRLRLARYKAAGVLGEAGGPLDREVVWWGLRDDARRHPRIRALRELAAIEARLRALAEAPGLTRLDREGSR